MAVLTNKRKNEIVVTCSCGCKNGVHPEIRKDENETTAFLSLVSDKFFSEQGGFFSRLAEKLRRILCILLNKEYSYFEVCLNETDLREFKEFVSSL